MDKSVRSLLYAGSGLLAFLLVLAGCDLSSSGSVPTGFTAESGWHERTITSNNQTRQFRFYVPDSLPDGAPVLMALHGAGRGMYTMFRGSGSGWSQELIEIAEEDSALLVVPNASPNHAVVWNGCSPTTSGPDDVAFLSSLADWTVEEAGVDSNQVYVLGVSNGGQMAYRLGIERPNQFAALGVIISNLASLGPNRECQHPADPIPIVIANGTRDQVTPFEGGRVLDGRGTLLSAKETRDVWVEANDAVPSARTVQKFDRDNDGDSTVVCGITPAPTTGAEVKLCRVKGGGHDVPTIDHENNDPPANRDVEASRLAWRFFQKQ